MPANNEGLAAAINSALSEVSPSDETVDDETPDEEIVDEETPAAETSDEETPDDETADEETADEENTDEETPDEETPDGETPAIDPKTGQPAVKEPKPVVKDPVNDPIPNALKKETKERIQSLIATVKTLSADKEKEVAQLRADRDDILGMITETKATPEQYGQALSYLQMVNSGDPAQQQQALAFMQQEVVSLSKILGVVVPGVDLLAGHPDLKQGVADGEISAKHAEELAAAREQAKVRTATANHSREQQQTTAQSEKERQDGYTALNVLGRELATKDGALFTRKKDLLVTVLQESMQNSHPSKWAKIFKAAYDKLNLPAPVKKRTVVPANQPLRGKNPSGGAQREAGSMLDAVNAALDGK